MPLDSGNLGILDRAHLLTLDIHHPSIETLVHDQDFGSTQGLPLDVDHSLRQLHHMDQDAKLQIPYLQDICLVGDCCHQRGIILAKVQTLDPHTSPNVIVIHLSQGENICS
jgi:hypothetical protein